VLTERFCTTVEFFYTWPVFESSSEFVTSAMLNALLGIKIMRAETMISWYQLYLIQCLRAKNVLTDTLSEFNSPPPPPPPPPLPPSPSSQAL